MKKQRIRKYNTYEEAFEAAKDRFVSKAVVQNPNDFDSCWIWVGTSINRQNYGRINIEFNNNRVPLMVHRFSYMIYNGEIPKGLFVCHNCPDGDNPACVNPNHLWLGNHQDNMDDMSNKGRALGGKRNPKIVDMEISTKQLKKELSWAKNQKDIDKVVELRMSGLDVREISDTMKIQREVIWRILSGKTYKKEMEKYKGKFKTTKRRFARNFTNTDLLYISKLKLAGVTQRAIAKLVRTSESVLSTIIKSDKYKSLENYNG